MSSECSRRRRKSSAGGTTEGEDSKVAGYETRFRASLADDLDLPMAMALVAQLIRSDVAASKRASLLISWDQVLGLDLDRAPAVAPLPDGAPALLEAREKARAAKDFATSDRLRRELAALGVAVTDTAQGQRWRTTPAKAR